MILLPIKRRWFDMIASGEKKEEYRSITKRYLTMFKNAADKNGRFWCIIQNGYSKSSPRLYCYVEASVDYGRQEWGADPETQYFVLKIIDKRTKPSSP